MKGFIVGYTASWADDCAPVLVGYYTTWYKALNVVKIQVYKNIKYYQSLRKIYVVEIEVNKTYPDPTTFNWYEPYLHYMVETSIKGTFVCGNGKRVRIDLRN